MHSRLRVLGVALLAAAGPASAGIADSPVPLLMGQKAQIVYSVPGAIVFASISTFVSCTSTSTLPIQWALEAFNQTGTIQNDASATSLTLPPGDTQMFGFATSADLGLFPGISKLIPNMSGLVGAVRVLSTSKSLICNAFIGDTTSNPPLLMSYLPLIAKTKQKAAN